MVRIEQKDWPSSNKVACRAAGERSWNRSSCKTVGTLARSTGLRARAGVDRSCGQAGSGAGEAGGTKMGRCR